MGQKTTLALSNVTVSEECTLSWTDKTQFESSSMNAKKTLCSLEQRASKQLHSICWEYLCLEHTDLTLTQLICRGLSRRKSSCTNKNIKDPEFWPRYQWPKHVWTPKAILKRISAFALHTNIKGHLEKSILHISQNCLFLLICTTDFEQLVIFTSKLLFLSNIKQVYLNMQIKIYIYYYSKVRGWSNFLLFLFS